MNDAIGVYFSPATRNYFAREYLPSYWGTVVLLMQSHLAYQIVTPRTLAQFHGPALVLSDVRVLGELERQALQRFTERGGKLIVTGEDATRTKQNEQVARFAESPGKRMRKRSKRISAGQIRANNLSFSRCFLPVQGEIKVQASPAVATHITRIDGKVHVFLVNFKGLRSWRKRSARKTEIGA